MADLVTRIWAVRARMVDGAVADLLLFFSPEDAHAHAQVVRDTCRAMGWDRIDVVPRRVIGKNEPLERRKQTTSPWVAEEHRRPT